MSSAWDIKHKWTSSVTWGPGKPSNPGWPSFPSEPGFPFGPGRPGKPGFPWRGTFHFRAGDTVMVLLQPIKSMFALKPGCATGSFSYLLEVQEIQEDPENEQPFLNEIKTWDWTFSLMDNKPVFLLVLWHRFADENLLQIPPCRPLDTSNIFWRLVNIYFLKISFII